MSNRNFDYRVATQRRADRVIAQNIYSYQQSGLSPISNPLTSSASPQRVGQFNSGIQTTFYKGLTGGSYMGSIGGTANYILSTEELAAVTETITSIPAGNSPAVEPSAPPAVVPSPPTDLRIEADYESAIIQFTEGFNGNSPIINYQFTIDEGLTFQLFDPPQVTSPITISGLTSGITTYNIALKAVNSVGVSEVSEYVFAIPIVAPSPPTDLSGIPGDGQVTILFNTGFNGNSPIINYQYSIDNGLTFTEFDPANTTNELTIYGLTNSTTYQIQLKAMNAFGASSASATVSAIPSTLPSPPTDLLATPGNGQVTISFTPGSNGGSQITNYQYSIDNGDTFNVFNPEDAASPVTIYGLTNGTTYQIKLKAVNAAGIGSESDTVSATPSTVPSPPTGLSATPGDGQVTISFTPGFNGGSDITNYQYSTNNGTSFTAFSPADSASPVTITGLTNGTTYQIKLKAVNANGASSASTPVSATPSGVPSPPTNLEAVPGNTSAYILFTAGNDGGSAITNYEYSTDGGNTFTACNPAQTQSPITIDGLSTTTTYTIVLKAVNAIGSSNPSTSVSVTTQANTLNTTDLIVNLNAADSNSYPGSGTAWTNLASGGLYSATLNNTPTFNSANPKALVFNGTDEYAEIANATAIQPSVGRALTAQIWAKVNSGFTPGDGLISKQYWSPSYDGYSLSLNTNNSVVLNMNGSSVNGNYSSGNNVFTTDTWALYTIVVRFGGGSANPSYAYVSTRRVVSANNGETGIPTNTAPIQIPRGIQNSTFNFAPADIGAFYYYSRALTQQEIIQNFDATRARFSV